ncbi:hypothetical protein PHACT_11180 [Pseudohongiella acticola]|jgi:uncharacterized protein|uniref:Uncharacterized protein n=1 Tax=Pseudohongiella acticola TaxID=1524254 RepID=A0A1E8CMG9_9GAMM|nr:DUF692 domain-containing protein [Pseudohongiella acticola]OFE13629.1 hypothetical protein PHACT_11180 [Pseudohongiella acticola]
MLGFGIGLRSPHYDYVLEQLPAVDWFELITENYLAPGGRPRAILRQIREHYPVVLHGLSFNIGSAEAPDADYLKQLRQLINECQPAWVSDHLCWTGLHGRTSHDLLPIAYNQETLAQVSSKVSQIQDTLQQTIVLENPSVYLQFKSSDMSEADFINALVANTGCRILLDVNNVYVSSFNLDLDPLAQLKAIRPDCVQQYHLAGHTHNVSHIIDTHDQAVSDDVWALYQEACVHTGAVATLLERDDHIPAFTELMQELDQARQLQKNALMERSALQENAAPDQPSNHPQRA